MRTVGSASFRDAILVTLHSKTTENAMVLIDETLYEDIALLAGFPKEANLQRWNSRIPCGIRRSIHNTYTTLHRKCKVPLVVRGPRGWWGLTPAGRERALALTSNLTLPENKGTEIERLEGNLQHLREIMVDAQRQAVTVEERLVVLQSAVETEQVARAEALKAEAVEADRLVVQAEAERVSKDERKQKAATPKSNQNPTVHFLNQRLNMPGSKLLDTLRKAVASKMPVSATTNRIDDHVHNCIVKLVSRDALKDRIESGAPIHDHYIALWAINSAYGDIRSDGTEPVTRELCGARTERERTKKIQMGDLSDPRLVWGKTKSEGNKTEWVDIADQDSPLSASAMEDAVAFGQMWNQIEQVVSAKVPETAPQYLAALRRKAEGFTLNEIADADGLTVPQVHALLRDAKNLVRKSLRIKKDPVPVPTAPLQPSRLNSALARLEALRAEAASL